MQKNLKLRIITALIGAPVVLGLLFGFGVEGVSIVAWVISCGMWFEFGGMFFKLADRNTKIAITLVMTTIIHWGHYWLTVGIHPVILGLVPVLALSVVFLLQVPRLLRFKGADELNTAADVATLKQHLFELTAAAFGVVYCSWYPLLMVDIRQMELGVHWLAFTLLSVWSADTFAYFAGSAFGKTKLFPSVSPKKSWEGVAGGVVGAIAVTQAYAHFFIPEVSRLALAVMALSLCLASVLGDLVESLIKRAMEVKDSGNLLPGHGGFLDRFDGVVFALPVMYLFLWVFL